ncbi:MAG: hypothetical protein E7399_06915 [Ruminococcaceae bacterium]|nr:hypothetical protein [Oscillospiraceae bacterium]
MSMTVLKKNESVKRTKKLPSFLLELLFCFFAARTTLFGQPLPAGIALASIAAKSKKGRWFCILSTLCGYLTLSFHPRYPIALCLLSLVLWIDEELFFRNSLITGISVAGATLISDLYFLIQKGSSIYDTLILLLCTTGGFLYVIFFEDALPVLKTKTRRYLRQKDSLAITVLFCTVARGLPLISSTYFSLNDCFCILLTLLFSRLERTENAVIVGLISAFLTGADSTGLFTRMGMFALAGLIGSMVRPLGKLGICGGALLAGLLTSLTTGELSLLHVKPLDFPVACLISLLIPDRLIQLLGLYHLHPNQSENEARIKESLCQQLKNISAAFLQLSSSVFALAGQPKIETDQSVLLSKIEERACNDCKLKELCWKRETGEMERLICHCFAIIEQNGSVCNRDVPIYFQKRCNNLSKYLYEINNLYELYKNELFWQGRLDRATAFTIRQLEDVSAVVDKLANQLNQNVSFNEELAFAVSCELDRLGFSPKEVEVAKNTGGRYEVHLKIESCQMTGGCKEITSVLSQLLECPIEKTEGDCKLGQCVLGFSEATPYRLLHAVSSTPRAGQSQSGDTTAVLTLPDGNLLLILSDGKGSGDKAHLQSSETVRLICRLLYAGFTPTSAVRLANSVLGQQPDEEGFATIDLMLIDLSHPRADFIKSGACATYIKRQNLVKRIESQSLPAGILDEADMELKSESLLDGDLLVMLSDGVTDAYSDEKFLMTEINRLSRHNSPRQLAAALLDSAKQQKGNTAWDDMTVVAARIVEK